MNLPIQLHYRASFDVSEPYMKGELWSDCTKEVRKWIAYKVGRPPQGDFFWKGWFFRGGDWNHPKDKATTIRTSSLIGAGTETAPQFWALSYRHADKDCTHRMWQTDIGITVLDDHRLRFNIQIGHYMRANFLGEMPALPEPSAPGIIPHLLTKNRWNCKAGSQELLAKPEAIQSGHVEAIVKALKNKDRSCPVILISKGHDEARPFINTTELQRLTAGAASVYLLETEDVESEFEFWGAKRYRCENGMIRVYLPDLDFNNEHDAHRHRFFFPRQILEEGAESVVRQLVRMCCRFAPKRKGQSIFALEELHSIARADRLRQLRGEKTDGNQDEWIKLLEETNQELEENIQTLEAERDALQRQVLEREDSLSSRQYEVRSARKEADRLRKDANQAQMQLNALQAFTALPESLSDVLQKIGTLHADKVIVTEQAIKSAEGYKGFSEINKAWECLWAVATELHTVHFLQTGSINIEQDFRSKTGFDLSLKEGRMTQNDSDLMKLRQVQHNGKMHNITPHVKWGNKEPKCLRVYYAACPDEKKIIIGHCGPHLNNRTTSKLK